MNYYDIPERPLEPPYYEPIGYCAECGGEIYEGQDIYEIQKEWFCEDCIAYSYTEAHRKEIAI